MNTLQSKSKKQRIIIALGLLLLVCAAFLTGYFLKGKEMNVSDVSDEDINVSAESDKDMSVPAETDEDMNVSAETDEDKNVPAESDEDINVSAGSDEDNRYQVQSKLLMDAMNYLGVNNPDEAVKIWTKGLIIRSAALQYSVMTEELKSKYAEQLEQNEYGWVTGISSPWVEGYEIVEKKTIDPENYQYKLKIQTLTTNEPPEYLEAVLDIVKKGEFWQISSITADEKLYIYTFFQLD